jgi:hypothetical protein
MKKSTAENLEEGNPRCEPCDDLEPVDYRLCGEPLAEDRGCLVAGALKPVRERLEAIHADDPNMNERMLVLGQDMTGVDNIAVPISRRMRDRYPPLPLPDDYKQAEEASEGESLLEGDADKDAGEEVADAGAGVALGNADGEPPAGTPPGADIARAELGLMGQGVEEEDADDAERVDEAEESEGAPVVADASGEDDADAEGVEEDGPAAEREGVAEDGAEEADDPGAEVLGEEAEGVGPEGGGAAAADAAEAEGPLTGGRYRLRPRVAPVEPPAQASPRCLRRRKTGRMRGRRLRTRRLMCWRLRARTGSYLDSTWRCWSIRRTAGSLGRGWKGCWTGTPTTLGRRSGGSAMGVSATYMILQLCRARGAFQVLLCGTPAYGLLCDRVACISPVVIHIVFRASILTINNFWRLMCWTLCGWWE